MPDIFYHKLKAVKLSGDEHPNGSVLLTERSTPGNIFIIVMVQWNAIQIVIMWFTEILFLFKRESECFGCLTVYNT